MDPESLKNAVDLPVATGAWLRTVGLMLFAGVAGVLGSVMRAMDAQQPIRWGRVLLEFAASGMVGLMVIWLCQYWKVSIQITGVSTGIFGWLGAKVSLQLLQKFVWDKLGLNRSKEDVPAE